MKPSESGAPELGEAVPMQHAPPDMTCDSAACSDPKLDNYNNYNYRVSIYSTFTQTIHHICSSLHAGAGTGVETDDGKQNSAPLPLSRAAAVSQTKRRETIRRGSQQSDMAWEAWEGVHRSKLPMNECIT